jgi:hypothetical protein
MAIQVKSSLPNRTDSKTVHEHLIAAFEATAVQLEIQMNEEPDPIVVVRADRRLNSFARLARGCPAGPSHAASLSIGFMM